MKMSVYYLLTILIWGSTWYAITFQLGSVDESVSLFYRFGLAAVLLLAYCLLRHERMRFTPSEHLYMAGQGLFLFSSNYLLFYWCTAYITSGLVAVIFSTVIVMNIFNGAVFLKRRVRALVLLGALLGLVGITLVFWHEVADVQETAEYTRIVRGLMLGLLATYIASLGNIMSARNQAAGLPVLQSNAYGMAYGSGVMLIYAMFSGANFEIDGSITYWSSLLYLSVFGSIVAFGAYLSLIGRIGADRAAYATVLFPIVALLISSTLEDFQWTKLSIMGVVLVLLGNVLVAGRKALDGALVGIRRHFA